MVYYDAKKFVLPEYSFTTRAVVNMMASTFKYNSDDNIITNTDLQYLTPHTHKEVLYITNRLYFNTMIKSMENILGSNVNI